MTTKYIATSIVLILALIVGAIYFYDKDSSNNGGLDPVEMNFTETGHVFKDNPGFKSGVWHLSYGEPGKPGLSVELKFNNEPSDLQNGQTVKVEGYNSNQVVEVSKLELLNAHKDNLIWVDSPLPNETITNPITLHGYAKGSWFFEASFPVKVLDANGKLLAQAPAQAQGEWMTDEYVEFLASLNFSKSNTATGTLVLEKDNPSGLPQNADELRIPITFGEEGRAVKLYYYNPEKDKDASGNIQCSKDGLVSVDRQIPITLTPIQDTIKLLLTGAITTEEKSQGITTEYPLPGLELKGANQVGSVLTLEFSDPQNKTGGGSCRVSILWSQIEATAKQFPGVSTVKFIPEELFQP